MITKDNAKAWLPLVQAMAEGKALQFRLNEHEQWRDLTCPHVMPNADPVDQIRIKPEPKWRAWKEGEIPKYIILRWEADRVPDLLVNGCWMNGSKPSLDVLLVNYVRILEDGSEVPCGVREVDGE